MRDILALPTLRSRFLTVFLSVILIIFLGIIWAFNVLVDNYISSTATAQLSAVIQAHPIQNPSGDAKPQLPDITGTAPSQLNTRPAVFMINQEFSPSVPAAASETDILTATSLAKALKAQDRALADIQNLPLATQGNSFYLSCVAVGSTGEYLVFYVDVTGITNLASSVNSRLLSIMISAILINFVVTFLVTQRLTRPLADLTTFARRLGQGDFSPYVRTFHDREMATLAETMNQAASQLDTYDQDQKTFFQNVSHELRTPLMSITCQAEGIAYGVMDPEEASRKILSETARLTEMVEELLSISRIDSITPEQAMISCDLSQLLTVVAEDQRRMAESRGLTINLTCDGPSVTIQGNEKTLHGALSNLISNAIRYARQQINLSCELVNGQAVVTVSDDGPGISEDELPHIFERFYKGTDGVHGIGLAIVKSVADQHLARVEVSSTTAGATFRLIFPSAS